jgi:hypothetical protein
MNKSRITLFLMVFVFLFTACQAGQPPVSQPGNLPVGGGIVPSEPILQGLPEGFLGLVNQAKADGAFIGSHGTTMWTIIAPKYLAKLGYPSEMVNTAQILQGFEQLQAQNIGFVCLNRPCTANLVSQGNWLWVGLEGLDSEPVGSGLYMSLNKALAFQRYGGGAWSLETALARLNSATTPADTAFFTQQVDFWTRVENAVKSGILTQSDKELIQTSLKTPISVQFKLTLSEVTRTSRRMWPGVGSRVRSGNLPLVNAVGFTINDDTPTELIQMARQAMPQAQQIGGPGAQAVKSLWSSIPQGAYNTLWNIGKGSQTVIEWMPALGFFAVVFSPLGIIVSDYSENQSDWESIKKAGNTDLRQEEYQEIYSDVINDLKAFGCDSGGCLLKPLAELLESSMGQAAHFTPWTSYRIGLGEGPAEIVPVVKAGTTFLCSQQEDQNSGKFLISDECVIDTDQSLPAIKVELLNKQETTNDGKKGPLIKVSWPTDSGWKSDQTILAENKLSAGCQDNPDGSGIINRVFRVRYITGENWGYILLLLRPDFFVSSSCIMN